MCIRERTEVNDLNNARAGGGCTGATNTAAITFASGGSPHIQTETWNGTNWTAVNNMNQARFQLGEAGTSTAALGFGGYRPSPATWIDTTELWNGTNWTEVNDLNTARYELRGAGSTNTAAIAIGG